MKQQRSKFWTIIFSFMPGAGHMFMGFMKKGLSLMGAFCIIVMVAAALPFGPLLFLLPVLWFYAFFDAINLRFSPPEVFAQAEDRYLFPSGKAYTDASSFLNKNKRACGVALIVFGALLLWNGAYESIRHLFSFSDYFSMLLDSVGRAFPQVCIALLIIGAGFLLIFRKKKEMDEHDER